MSEHIQLSLALCRIGFYTCLRTLCCKGPPPPRPEYDVVCIGLTGSGKSTLLSRLCSENTDTIVPTTEMSIAVLFQSPNWDLFINTALEKMWTQVKAKGFSIKAVPFQNAILNVKELGGAAHIKKYWSRYYQGSQGVVFVVNSACSAAELEASRAELHSALQHPQLCTLPFLILAHHQDQPSARPAPEIQKYFELEPLARGKRWVLAGSSTGDLEGLRDAFGQLINLLEDKHAEHTRI